jgi:hypothetical protein
MAAKSVTTLWLERIAGTSAWYFDNCELPVSLDLECAGSSAILLHTEFIVPSKNGLQNSQWWQVSNDIILKN